MAKTQTEQTSNSEVSNSEVSSTEQKDFNSLSLNEMEQNLEAEKETVKTKQEPQKKDSENQEEDSDEEQDSKPEQPSSEETDDKSEKVESEEDKQPEKTKAHRELEAEFTRRSQRLKELEAELQKNQQLKANVQDKSDQTRETDQLKKDVLARLKEENPNAAQFIDALSEAINERIGNRLKEKIDPIEERVTLRTRQENTDKFFKESENFKTSDLAELEPEVMQVFNSEPAFWQQLILESPDAFQQLLNTAITKNLEKVVSLKTKVSKNKADSISASKRKEIDKATVGRPSGKTKDIPLQDFKKLSLDEMEKAIPNADE